MQSIFIDKQKTPTETDLQKALGETYPYWQELSAFIRETGRVSSEKWHYSGEKYGWAYRLSDEKRVLVYLLPRHLYFKTAFVFGGKATSLILESSISEAIKLELNAAKVYAEGRGIRIDVKDPGVVGDIKKLITIKTGN